MWNTIFCSRELDGEFFFPIGMLFFIEFQVYTYVGRERIRYEWPNSVVITTGMRITDIDILIDVSPMNHSHWLCRLTCANYTCTQQSVILLDWPTHRGIGGSLLQSPHSPSHRKNEMPLNFCWIGAEFVFSFNSLGFFFFRVV